jgi:hypothetical protein
LLGPIIATTAATATTPVITAPTQNAVMKEANSKKEFVGKTVSKSHDY